MDKACMECSYFYDCEAGVYLVSPCQQDDDDLLDDDLEYED